MYTTSSCFYNNILTSIRLTWQSRALCEKEKKEKMFVLLTNELNHCSAVTRSSFKNPNWIGTYVYAAVSIHKMKFLIGRHRLRPLRECFEVISYLLAERIGTNSTSKTICFVILLLNLIFMWNLNKSDRSVAVHCWVLHTLDSLPSPPKEYYLLIFFAEILIQNSINQWVYDTW